MDMEFTSTCVYTLKDEVDTVAHQFAFLFLPVRISVAVQTGFCGACRAGRKDFR